MAKRKIIKFDEEKCNGCGLCIPECPEGAIQIIDGKARLVSDLFCDGLGACLGHCPTGAITIEEREAEPYDEKKVMENIIKAGPNTIKAHLEHLREHGEHEYLEQALQLLKSKGIQNPVEDHPMMKCGCPGSQVRNLRDEIEEDRTAAVKTGSQLRQWPVQITLVPSNAPYLKGADLLIAADCVPFAYGDFHREFLKGKVLLVGCPKLDDSAYYLEKLTEIFTKNDLKGITIAHMEVPCCFGLISIVKQALEASKKNVPLKIFNISIKGDIKNAG
jgi:ferredoxin